MTRICLPIGCISLLLALALQPAFPQNIAPVTIAATAPQKVILDTDIGDDIDDAFALALILKSPSLRLLGVTTAWGNTGDRAQLVKRFLDRTGHAGITVAAGPATAAKSNFTQLRWAQSFPAPADGWPDAVSFILNAIRKNPGQVTLIAIAPLTNVGALIEKDPATFRKLKRVVLMGGSIHRGYGDLGFLPDHGPSAEYNIHMDVPAAQKLFSSGVPIYMMPLDSTQLKLNEVLRTILFSQATPYTDALAGLYYQWRASTLDPTPTLYDAMAAAYAVDPAICPTTPLHIEVTDQGYTRETAGKPNANVCLHSNSSNFFHFYLHAVLQR